jgi:hypothetical protein
MISPTVSFIGVLPEVVNQIRLISNRWRIGNGSLISRLGAFRGFKGANCVINKSAIGFIQIWLS